ncbi:hypothetical protein LIER_18744 [Lithospermum erythrorhizon]|uniref:Uncharacterized protein n=1 Tax=Lithospermum erythrorhizon TaxID=34254 RepID=A0AAV3QF48_LITER
MHVDVRLTSSDSWNSVDEQQGDNNEEVEHGFDDDGDVEAVMSRRRKARGKAKINDNITRVGNKRVPKNIPDVPTDDVSLNTD